MRIPPNRAAQRRALSVATGLLLSIVLATEGFALTWAAPRALTTSRNAEGHVGLAGSGSTFHAAYEEATGGVRRVYYRRSTDGGSTWSTPLQLSTSDAEYSGGATIRSRGSAIDVVWLEFTSTWLVRYRRSVDGGATWQGGVYLSSTSGSASTPAVIRDASSRVVVAWTDDTTGKVQFRRSTDGGAGFGGTVVLATSTNGSVGFIDAFPTLAVGTSVMYLAYDVSAVTVHVRRSTNGGATWSSAAAVTTSGDGFVTSIAASGATAVIGFGVINATTEYAAIRRTTDSGASWSSTIALTPTNGAPGFAPVLAVGNGRWHAVFERCATLACATSSTHYRSSPNGLSSWDAAVKVSSTTRPYAFPIGLAWANKLGLLYVDWDPNLLDSDVFFRAGS